MMYRNFLHSIVLLFSLQSAVSFSSKCFAFPGLRTGFSGDIDSQLLRKTLVTRVQLVSDKADSTIGKGSSQFPGKSQQAWKRALLCMFAAWIALHPIPHAIGAESRIVGQIKGSGLVFKDTLLIESFPDPKVKGVTLYISNFQRPLTERLTSNFFSDPSSAGVSCARTGKIEIADNINTSLEGEEVFEESKSLLFKTLRVQRIFDKEKNTVVYASFSTRLDKNDDVNNSRFKSSLCAVNLND